MAKLQKQIFLQILNLTKFLIDFLYLAKFLKLLNLAEFWIFLELSRFFDYSTINNFINLIVFIHNYY